MVKITPSTSSTVHTLLPPPHISHREERSDEAIRFQLPNLHFKSLLAFEERAIPGLDPESSVSASALSRIPNLLLLLLLPLAFCLSHSPAEFNA